MSGYRWDPVFRVSPFNGSDTWYWLADRLTDCGAANRITLRYVESQDVREDINRSLRAAVFGLRPEVEFEFQIVTMADQAFLAEIESALLQPRDYAVFLSLDGGVVERQVVLATPSSPDPLRGKTIVGAAFRLAVRCVDLITTKPAMMTDPGTGQEFLQDGGLEAWTSGSALQSWTASGVCTVAQESSVIAAGTYSAKCSRSDGVSSGIFQPSAAITTFAKGCWYRFRGSVRGTAAMTDAVRFRILNSTRNTAVASDGKTWASGDLVLKASITGAFDSLEAYFRFPTEFTPGVDTVFPRFQGFWVSTDQLYYDGLSIYGPVLRPGVATW